MATKFQIKEKTMISFNSNKGLLIDTVSMVIKIWKFQFAIYLGKEKSNAVSHRKTFKGNEEEEKKQKDEKKKAVNGFSKIHQEVPSKTQ